MEQLVALLSRFLEIFYNAMSVVVGGAISLVEWPANTIGVPPELLAAAILCIALLLLWRAMGGYFT